MASPAASSPPDTVEGFIASLGLEAGAAAKITALIENSTEFSISRLDSQANVQSTAALSCAVAHIALGSRVILDAASIEDLAKENWSKTCWKNAKCVIRPTSAKEVSQAIKVVNFFRTPFAVRSGGHSPSPGHAGVDNEVLLIDLAELKALSLSADKKLLSVGSGARWGDAYQLLDAHNLTVIGGRIPQIGIGGFLLGGGLSFFGAEYGLGADSAQNLEVVLADGSIVNANRKEKSDLFWALRGGGPNFGIVTRFDLRTIPLRQIWYQSTVYATTQAHEILDAFASWQQSGDSKSSTILVFTLSAIIVGLVYSEPIERPSVFQPFYDVPLLAPAIPSTIGTVLELINITGAGSLLEPIRHDYRTASSKVDVELYKEVYDFWVKDFTPVQEATGANMTFVLQHVPKSLVDKGNANGGNTLGLEPID